MKSIILHNSYKILCSAIVLFLSYCAKTPIEPEPIAWGEIKIGGLQAQLSVDKVNLSWAKPSFDFDYYRIYRTVKLDSLGLPDSTSLEATPPRDFISKDSSSFADVLEPSETIYYYRITAVKVLQGKVYENQPSDYVQCKVGNGLNFSINRGDLFTISNLCTLVVKDPDHKISSLRFCQMTLDSIDTSGSFVPAPADVQNAIPGDDANQIRDLLKYGFLQNKKSTGKIRRTKSVPNFLAVDSAGNNTASQNVTGLSEYPFAWTLLPGSGEKTVYAELSLTDGSKDTILDKINTQPHKLEVVFRNKVGFGLTGATMRDTAEPTDKSGNNLTKVKMFYTPNIQFSVKTYGDPTLYTDFDCFIIMDSIYQSVDRASVYLSNQTYLMTKPVSYALTGEGDQHDPDFAYDFSISDTTTIGKQALSSIKHCKGNNVNYTETSLPSAAAKELNDLILNQRLTTGKKQFIFVTRFRERYFNDVFISLYGYEGTSEALRMYQCSYLPIMNVDTALSKNPDHIGENSLILGKFNFALDSISLKDSAFATITNVSLLIAKKPDNYAWDMKVTPYQLTPELCRSVFRTQEFKYNYDKPKTTLTEVRWDDVDPTEWSTGSYIMGVVVSDEFGNSGFAVMNTGKARYQNPWLVQIRTAK